MVKCYCILLAVTRDCWIWWIRMNHLILRVRPTYRSYRHCHADVIPSYLGYSTGGFKQNVGWKPLLVQLVVSTKMFPSANCGELGWTNQQVPAIMHKCQQVYKTINKSRSQVPSHRSHDVIQKHVPRRDATRRDLCLAWAEFAVLCHHE